MVSNFSNNGKPEDRLGNKDQPHTRQTMMTFHSYNLSKSARGSVEIVFVIRWLANTKWQAPHTITNSRATRQIGYQPSRITCTRYFLLLKTSTPNWKINKLTASASSFHFCPYANPPAELLTKPIPSFFFLFKSITYSNRHVLLVSGNPPAHFTIRREKKSAK